MATKTKAAPAKLVAPAATFKLVPIELIDTSEFNPRKHFDPAYINELAESIKQNGVLQPIALRPNAKRYSIVVGECRYHGAKKAALLVIPAMIYGNITDAQHVELALIENLQRRDINPMEAARGYKRLMELGHTQRDIAASLNMAQPTIANAVRLLTLPDVIQQMIERGELSAAHGLELLSWNDWPKVQETIAQFAIAQNLPSKDVGEALANDRLSGVLQGEKLLQVFPGYNEPFDRARNCVKCEFNAYRTVKGKYSEIRVCLKPEHFKELARAAAKRRREKTVKTKEVMAKKGEVNTNKLGWGNYSNVSKPAPEGCSTECECRRKVQGDPSKSVCIDPKKYQKLEKADQKKRFAREDVEYAQLRDAAVAGMKKLKPDMLDRAAATALLKLQREDHLTLQMIDLFGYKIPDPIRKILKSPSYNRSAKSVAQLFDWYTVLGHRALLMVMAATQLFKLDYDKRPAGLPELRLVMQAPAGNSPADDDPDEDDAGQNDDEYLAEEEFDEE